MAWVINCDQKTVMNAEELRPLRDFIGSEENLVNKSPLTIVFTSTS